MKDTCVLAQLHEFDIQRFKMSQYKEYLHELNQGDIEFPMKLKEIPTFEQLIFLEKIELLSSKCSSPKSIDKNFNEELLDQFFSENHYCLTTNLPNFCGNNENNQRLWTRLVYICGIETKLNEHMLRCIKQEVSTKSYMFQKQKMKIIRCYKKRDPPM